MNIRMLKSKLNRGTVTDANLNYEGSISIDAELCAAAGLYQYERVDVLNLNNGKRFSTYVLKGKQGEICINGAAARLAAKGDVVTITAYTDVTETDAPFWQPRIVLLNEANLPKDATPDTDPRHFECIR